ncbi:glycine betaine/L-proline ABC transporter permease ProW [Roseospira goensis]|uniref:Glycine betaine/proline transport system permease protein n=1 Tax=Roseospira goensis TaxID=391922 RepID=A0A7W6RY38_9PROT|nr:glycine betaine/L-proline ABC transporter permease ProW [Roseospira goensis]MBB4285277.1 glycine betaine/proline transport system permease protein [Roseospira goensis]
MADDTQGTTDSTTPGATDSTGSNPWATGGGGDSAAPASESPASNPWGSSGGGDARTGGEAPAGSDWLSQAPAAKEESFDILHPFEEALIPLEFWVEQFLDWLVTNFRPVFQAIRWPVDGVLSTIEVALLGVPAIIMVVLIGLLAWQAAGWRLGIGAIVSLVFVGLIGAWNETMVTLALVITSVFFCILLGLPTGIWLARSDRAAQVVRPILDAMQTTPAFVYLVPIVMLFGIGNVPGVVVTIIFALPPVIRLTNLGIRQVPGDLIEAARSFGASGRQLLFKVQLPLAMPTIMAGVNQTLMLALSMVVIASMIAVGGLGQMVLRGIGRLDMGLATVGGIGIVLLAIIIDRMTQALGVSKRDRGNVAWFETGPVGLVRRLVVRPPDAPAGGAREESA